MLWPSLALFLSVAVVVWRVEAMVNTHLPAFLVRHDAPAESKNDPRPPLPPDLESMVVRETEAWAQDQMRTMMQDEYVAYGDWDTVRASHMGALG